MANQITGIDDTFKKFDDGKPPMGLLPWEALREIAFVLGYGGRKYEDPYNYRKGTYWSRYYDAALRHIYAWIGGEDFDPESGLNHLAHAGCCILFLLTFIVTRTGVDDRYRPEERMSPKENPVPRKFKTLENGRQDIMVVVLAGDKADPESIITAANKVRELGFTVVAPRLQPYDKISDITEYIRRADELVLLPGWENDPVAADGFVVAVQTNKTVWFWAESVGQFIGVPHQPSHTIPK